MDQTFTRIRDLFQGDIGRRIEEVVKVDQTNEEDVYNELNEYVVTDALRDAYLKVLDRYLETTGRPHEDVGVWVSGFFGSGKSSFAKILGYILENRVIKGRAAAEIFAERAADDRIRALLTGIHQRLPTTAVIFDVAKDRGVRSGSEMLTEIMYRAFLRELGYSDDPDLAELEIGLEADGRLEAFRERFLARFGRSWDERKKLIAFAISEASAVMHELEPATYPQPDSWAKARRQVDITANRFAERVLELMRRRRQGRTVVFVVDEVGQYVSRSVQKMLDLQGVVEALGRAGKGRAWLVVTSQEKLDEVVDSLEGRVIELARLQDRFATRIDMSPADISEVAGKRVLSKTPQAEARLKALYEAHQGALGTHTRVRSAMRHREIDAASFCALYPFLPYQVDLVIDVVSGLRRQPGASRHVGGSNRTIIKLAQQAIIHPKVALGDQAEGALVTLDMVYDLLEGNVASERQKDIQDIEKAWLDNPLMAKVAKALCMLEFEDKVARTAENVAAVLYPRVGAPSLLPQVEEALETLVQAQMAKLTEKGYTLLSVEAKQWETERRRLPDPKPADEIRLWREIVGELCGDLPAYRHRDVRNFTAALHVNGQSLGREGDIPLFLTLADDTGEFAEACRQAREESRPGREGRPGEAGIYWVAEMSEDVWRLVREHHKSEVMIERYERRSGKTAEEGRLLAEEKVRRDTLRRDLRLGLREVLLAGKTYFQGVERPAATLGRELAEVARRLLEIAVPEVYPKFGLAAVRVDGREAQALLSAANLNGLPAVCYEGEGRLGLVVRQGGRYAINLDAAPAREVLDFIRQQDAYGESVSGKLLESRFHGYGYGWDLEVVMLIVAALLRGGALEVSLQGRRAHSHADPGAREAFSKVPSFRAAAFRPRQAIDLRDLARAGQLYEQITGESLDLPEEGAIATALRRFFAGERERLVPLQERLRANGLPGVETVQDLLATMRGIGESAADDAVKTFAEQGGTIIAGLRAAAAMDQATTPGNLAVIQRARAFLQRGWPALAKGPVVDDRLRGAADRLWDNLAAPSFCERLPDIATDLQVLEDAYRALYGDVHARRAEAYRKAIEEVRSRPEWEGLPEEAKGRIIAPLVVRVGEEGRPLASGGIVFEPSIDQMESDLLAADGLLRQALAELERMAAPEERVERVVARRFFATSIGSPDDLEDALARLREHCLKLLSEGARVVIE